MKKSILLTVFFSITSLWMFGQQPQYHYINVSNNQHTVEKLVEDVLVGQACLVSNITWKSGKVTGELDEGTHPLSDNSAGIAYFDKGQSEFIFDKGIILSTGFAMKAKGRKNRTTTHSPSSWVNTDQQLIDYMQQKQAPGDGCFSATTLEFDFVPLKEEFSFDFLFASNEYGVHQCTFSDAFAFFLTDLTDNTVTNLAVLPNTDTPIFVTTVRDNKWQPQCSSVNKQYFGKFYGNANQYPDALPPASNPINFRGETVPLKAKSTVVPFRKYHIKLIIADRSDSSFDAAVFLRAGSFDIGNLSLGKDLTVEDNTALCEHQKKMLKIDLSPEHYSFRWLKDGQVIEGEETNSLEVSQAGTYTVEVTVKVLPDCILSTSIKVEVYPKFSPGKPQNIETCVIGKQSKSVNIKQEQESIITAPIKNIDVEISYYDSEENAQQATQPIQNVENYVSSQKEKTIYVRVQNKKTGCYEIQSFKLRVKEGVDVSEIEDLKVCQYDGGIEKVDLSYIVDNKKQELFPTPVEVSFFNTEEEAIEKNNPIQNYAQYQSPSLPHKIYVRVQNVESGCFSIRELNLVEDSQVPIVDLGELEICLKYKLKPLPPGQFYSTEEFGKGEILPVGKEYHQGEHTLYTNVTSPTGCIYSRKHFVKVVDCFIQKGISPNNDLINDGLELTKFYPLKVSIFNRYGTEVYTHGEGYTNQWKGQDINGNDLPEGTYYYIITTYTDQFSGYIYLSREM